MVVWAVRTYEPWNWASVLAFVVLLTGLVAVVIVATRRRNR